MVGSTGESYDNALAEAFNSLFKAELIRNRGPFKSLEDLEVAVAGYSGWFNHRRVHGEIQLVPPVEFEDVHHHEHPVPAPAGVALMSLQQTRAHSSSLVPDGPRTDRPGPLQEARRPRTTPVHRGPSPCADAFCPGQRAAHQATWRSARRGLDRGVERGTGDSKPRGRDAPRLPDRWRGSPQNGPRRRGRSERVGTGGCAPADSLVPPRAGVRTGFVDQRMLTAGSSRSPECAR
ncbi:integrase core domain-containing protein [Micrococcus sp.]|uniref:integrase core domain-containing protein n=1 Tax=Micrococcus sp. TaxID=1271 RepID=UPI0034A41764